MIESSEEFVSLRKSKNPDEYSRAAKDAAPLEVWEDIVNRFPDMKIWVIHNKTVPVEILKSLKQDPDPLVREAIARKRKCPEDILRFYAGDKDLRVRQAVVYNEKATKDVLEIMTRDSSPSVSEMARKRMEK